MTLTGYSEDDATRLVRQLVEALKRLERYSDIAVSSTADALTAAEAWLRGRGELNADDGGHDNG